tara:strand:- start:60693 stop:61487 length:795 start_codon:yes stop_codon:yes gene_type:complete
MLVVKIGGSEGINYNEFLQDFSRFDSAILIHGGSNELNRLSKKLNYPPRILKSASGYTSRFTDRKTMHMFNMIYAGKMNKMIVEKLQKLGKNAVGLTGLDGRLFEGVQNKALRVIDNGKKRLIRGDMTGRVKKMNTDLMNCLIEMGYTPVLTPPVISNENIPINVDGDRLAAFVAGTMKAEELYILSNVPGLLKNIQDDSSIIKNIKKGEIDDYISQYAKGRMKKKLIGAKEALELGVSKVVLSGARFENPLTNALKGEGTVIK